MSVKNHFLPFSETNSLPSVAVFHNPEDGVQSQLSSQLRQAPTYSQESLESVRDRHFIHGLGPMDQMAVVARSLADKAEAYSKSAFSTAFCQRIVNSHRHK